MRAFEVIRNESRVSTAHSLSDWKIADLLSLAEFRPSHRVYVTPPKTGKTFLATKEFNRLQKTRRAQRIARRKNRRK